jgi:glyoxylase-like metal-dependent hydrolase (beta-lactamase superfamily II)
MLEVRPATPRPATPDRKCAMTPPQTIDYGDGIVAIDAGYQRPGLAAFYLVVEGGRAAFIDTGTSHSLPQALAALAAAGLAPASVDYVIPTHVHLDHAGGAGRMMREFPQARLVIHPRGARHMIDPAQLTAGVMEVYGVEAAAHLFGEVPPVPAARVIEAPDRFVVHLNGRTLRFLDTPGHARHHFCVVDERSRSIFTGDTFGLSYREFDSERGACVLPTTTPVQFEPAALHASIDRLMSERPQQVFLTHFGRVTELVRLAHDLHELIDAFVAMAQSCRDAGAGRIAQLIAGQRAILLPRLAAHGCRLPPEQIDDLLAGDFELNAQGMAVWLDRERRAVTG